MSSSSGSKVTKGSNNSTNTKSPSLPKVVPNTPSNKATLTSTSGNSNQNSASQAKSNTASNALPSIKNTTPNKTPNLKKDIEKQDVPTNNINEVNKSIEDSLTSAIESSNTSNEQAINVTVDTSTTILSAEQSNNTTNPSTIETIIPPPLEVEVRVIHNNGKVILNYVMYNEEFPIVNGCLTQAEIDDVYCLSDAMPGCSIHLSRYPPNVGRQKEAENIPFEEIYIREDPKGTYHDLEDDQTLYVYVEEEAQQKARDQARMRAIAAATTISTATTGIVRDDGRNMESCSCIYGNPCVDEYGCKDWDNRYAIAKINGWKGF